MDRRRERAVSKWRRRAEKERKRRTRFRRSRKPLRRLLIQRPRHFPPHPHLGRPRRLVPQSLALSQPQTDPKVLLIHIKIPTLVPSSRQLERVLPKGNVVARGGKDDDRGSLTAGLDPADVADYEFAEEDHRELGGGFDPF